MFHEAPRLLDWHVYVILLSNGFLPLPMRKETCAMGRHAMTVESEERQSKLEFGVGMHSVDHCKSHDPTHRKKAARLEEFGGHRSPLSLTLLVGEQDASNSL